MEKWVYAVHTICQDPSREQEFNEWYDEIHLPDVLETPGIKRARRYEIRKPTEEQGKYVAFYEVETEDIDQTIAELRETVAGKREQGRMSELVNIVLRVLYKQISDVG